jgi:beta-xylosidase
MDMRSVLLSWMLAAACTVHGQQQPVSKVWRADLGNGTYKNPVLHADYSDPDATRVGNDFYMTASSFEDVPGLPILHSTDLVNWRLIGHALPALIPYQHFLKTRHGEGVWAPSIRYHKNKFYIYYPDPDFGIYVITSTSAAGPWTAPQLVLEGKGFIDPCPLWDDDGKAYLVHAFAGSRAGIKSVLAIRKMNAEGTKTTDNGVLVYDGHESDPTIEGPKIYKRKGYYYIFAPAGGVPTGWQLVLRSKNIYGPYERKVVMDQGSTPVNGPHQGAWVTTASGEDWFLHFQDKEAYGRIVHLQPMQWKNDWPVIGTDKDGDGKGEPVLTYRKPRVAAIPVIQTPPDTDEFNATHLGLQWQWMGNPESNWHFMNPARGVLRLFSDKLPDSSRNLWDAPQVLLQKFPGEVFTATTKMRFIPNPKMLGEKAGLTIMGLSYAHLSLKHTKDGIYLVHAVCKDASKGTPEQESTIAKLEGQEVFLRVQVSAGAQCRFSYSLDGIKFMNAGDIFQAVPGRWKGAKVGIFCVREQTTNDAGWADFDWFRVEPATSK